MKRAAFVSAVKSVFDACRRLSELSGGKRPFTPDGRMVGDIGEVIADRFYQVSLGKEGRTYWDGTYGRRNVQIKATGGDSTYLKEPPTEGFSDGLLMVIHIDRQSGQYDEVYNGDIQRVWNSLKSRPDRTGAKMISLDRLRELQKSVQPKDIIPKVES